ncbi:RNA-binding cell elongation regulator Jag/EloR [Salsuginibacillus kocurii]|uniref:RNA-binding cell elongation regulator Jag/EloR n=1 Tax=Salsuginibacillus kocurii TaxID=427078 RepID=UPI00035F55AB|nr:RNA-binding cell elongation regulator Jag/EloR [Salsuginibacillus kocurii]
MKSVRVFAHTVELALEQAAKDLHISRDKVKYTVIQEAKKGFLGFGKKEAIIDAYYEPHPIEVAKTFLTDVLNDIMVEATVSIFEQKNKEAILHVEGTDLGVLIGKRGQTLDALETLVNMAANQSSDQSYYISLDAEGYRKKRKQALEQLAARKAEEALGRRHTISLEPMNARDRKIIHQALQNKKGINTYSNGDEPKRHIVIEPE